MTKHSKICPANKFSLFNGCVSWLKVVNIFGLVALVIIIALIYMTYNKQTLLISTQPSPNTSVKAGDGISNKNKRQNFIDLEPSPDIAIKVNPLFNSNDPDANPSDNTATPASKRVAYDINLNIRDIIHDGPNPNLISYAQYQADKDVERIINPILPPERSYENSYGIPINQPSRGPTGAYQQVGFLSQTTTSGDANGKNNENLILPLMGRPIYFGSRNWSYYTFSEKYQTVKLPLTHKGRKCDSDIGCDELYEGDKVKVPPYHGEFTVHLYDYDKPSYIPYVY